MNQVEVMRPAVARFAMLKHVKREATRRNRLVLVNGNKIYETTMKNFFNFIYFFQLP